MKVGLPIFALLIALTSGCSSVPSIVSDQSCIPDGHYIPNPKKILYAGAFVEIRGTVFTYEYFTDAVPETPIPPVTGTIKKEGRHFVFERAGSAWRIWLLGTIHGRPVLWPEESYEQWKATRRRESLDDVLYLKEEPNSERSNNRYCQWPQVAVAHSERSAQGLT